MKVALASGAWPPVRCGVADYSARLADALRAQGIAVAEITVPPAIGRARALLQTVRESGADLLHVQYPTALYGRSVVPAVLPLLAALPVVATLHEFSIFRWYRLPWFVPFAYRTGALVLTSEAELRAIERRLPGAGRRAQVIPIGSNIPKGKAAAREPGSVAYFGLLMPDKGLEEFLAFASELRGKGDRRVLRLIGGIPPGQDRYARRILDEVPALGIAAHVDLPPAEIAALLSQTAFAYLPGPGGVSERRGSVLAALENGVRVVGPVGAAAPAWLRATVLDAPTPARAVRAVEEAEDGANVAVASEAGWDSIAARHRALYDSVLA